MGKVFRFNNKKKKNQFVVLSLKNKSYNEFAMYLYIVYSFKILFLKKNKNMML